MALILSCVREGARRLTECCLGGRLSALRYGEHHEDLVEDPIWMRGRAERKPDVPSQDGVGCWLHRLMAYDAPHHPWVGLSGRICLPLDGVDGGRERGGRRYGRPRTISLVQEGGPRLSTRCPAGGTWTEGGGSRAISDTRAHLAPPIVGVSEGD